MEPAELPRTLPNPGRTMLAGLQADRISRLKTDP